MSRSNSPSPTSYLVKQEGRSEVVKSLPFHGSETSAEGGGVLMLWSVWFFASSRGQHRWWMRPWAWKSSLGLGQQSQPQPRLCHPGSQQLRPGTGAATLQPVPGDPAPPLGSQDPWQPPRPRPTLLLLNLQPGLLFLLSWAALAVEATFPWGSPARDRRRQEERAELGGEATTMGAGVLR